LGDKENKMKAIARQSYKKAAFTPLEKKPHPLGVVKKRGGGLRSHPSFLTGFTIIELLTVMSVIIILIGLLVPGLNALRAYARTVAQRKQFHAIGVALETFSAEWDGYPQSNGGHSGATQLASALVGRDLRGYSIIHDYNEPIDLSNRRLYLPPTNANAHKLMDLYVDLPLAVGGDEPVLCDVYPYAIGTGIGMPVLYYRANTSAPDLLSIYNYADNEALVALGKPWESGAPHRLNEEIFHKQIQNRQVGEPWTPYRTDSFILMSAGADGEYGTDDDIFNFGRR